jgi:Cu(I)/Ag(I) efflux system membrane protein CusA/SilA
MAGAAILAVTLIPLLMVYLIRGKIPTRKNPSISDSLRCQPFLDKVLAFRITLLVAILVLLATLYPTRIGGIYAATDEAICSTCLRRCLALRRQGGGTAAQTDRLIKTVPEVASVFGRRTR